MKDSGIRPYSMFALTAAGPEGGAAVSGRTFWVRLVTPARIKADIPKLIIKRVFLIATSFK
jgi:hypothetical protein